MRHIRFAALAAATMLSIAAALPASALSPRKAYIRDFDGDGKADLLWQGPATGGWLMNGSAIKSARAFTPPDAASGDTVLTGDFDGDGKTDLLWRGRIDERYDVVLMDGLAARASATVSAAGSGWEAVGTGDFDRDGKTDILWKHTRSGDFRVTYMNGTSVRGTQAILAGRPELSAALVADFTGDGYADIVFTAADGTAYLASITGPNTLDMRKVLDAGTGWWPSHAGDFDGDGHADIVWRDKAGRHGIWLMANPLAPQPTLIMDVNNGWAIRFVRDLDGDGRSDIVWSNPDGSQAAWLMAGATATRYATLLGPGTGWSIVASDDYDGDGKDDLLWRHSSGAYGIWMMDGVQAVSYRALLDGGTGWDTAVAYEGCDRTVGGAFHILGATDSVPATGQATSGSSKSVLVQRSPGACGGAYTLRFNTAFTPLTGNDSSGYAPLPSGSITYADGEAGIRAFTISTGNSPGVFTATLIAADPLAGASATSAWGSFALTIPQRGGGSMATYTLPALNAQQFFFGTTEPGSYPALKPGETIAAQFVYQQTSSAANVSVAQVTNPSVGGATDIEIAISSLPADFPGSRVGADTLCSKRLAYPSTAMTVIYGMPNVFWACNLTPGATYYINVRQVSANYANGDTPSCRNPDGCALRVQPQNLY